MDPMAGRVHMQPLGKAANDQALQGTNGIFQFWEFVHYSRRLLALHLTAQAPFIAHAIPATCERERERERTTALFQNVFSPFQQDLSRHSCVHAMLKRFLSMRTNNLQ